MASVSANPTVAAMHPLAAIVLVLPFLVLPSSRLGAAVWTGGDSADWSHPGNWAGAAPPGTADPVWDIPEGSAVTLTGAAPGGAIVKRGGGLLRVGPGLEPATVIEVEAGRVSWSEAIALGHLRVAGGRAEGPGLAVGLLEVTGGAEASLADLPDLAAASLRVDESGTLRWHASAQVGTLEVAGGRVDFGAESIWPAVHLSGGALIGNVLKGEVTASGGTLDARVEGNLLLMGEVEVADISVSGQTLLAETTLSGWMNLEGGVWMAAWAGASRIGGWVELHHGSTLNWWLETPWITSPLIVTGELTSPADVPLGLGLVDWTHPYWDEARELLLVDAWEGGIVSATFALDPWLGEGEGAWEQVRSPEGDVVLRWTPDEIAVAAVPEPSAAGLALGAMLAAAISARRRRARPR